MKIGAENKKELVVMAVLLAVALLVGVYNFRDVLWGSSAAAPPSAPASAAQPKTAGVIAIAQDTDPRLRLDILEASRKTKYEVGRNIFAQGPIVVPTPRDSVRTGSPTPTPPPTPTPIPPIPLKFYGFASKPGEPKRVFLEQGGRVFVAGQNEIVDRRYKVIQIQANSVLMEDMLNNNRQPIPLTTR